MQNRGTPDPNWIHLLFESWNPGQKWTLLISISCALPQRRVWTLPSDSYPPEQEHSFGSLFSPTMWHRVHFAVALHDQRCLLTAKHVRLTLGVKKSWTWPPTWTRMTVWIQTHLVLGSTLQVDLWRPLVVIPHQPPTHQPWVVLCGVGQEFCWCSSKILHTHTFLGFIALNGSIR